jgi:hypothetical protein
MTKAAKEGTAIAEGCLLELENAELRKALEEIADALNERKQNAARYQWLREEWSNRKWRHVPIGAGMEGDDITSPEEIDAIIDKAMGRSSE